MGSEQTTKQVTPLSLDTPVHDDQVRFVCMSDTHNDAACFSSILPPGDVFLHAGDFTHRGLPKEVKKFNKFLGTSQQANAAYLHDSWFMYCIPI